MLVAVLMVVMVTAMRDHLNEALATTVAPRILHKESATIPSCGEGQGQGHGWVTVGLKTHGEAIWMGELAGVLCGLARAMDLVRDGGVGQEGRDAFSPLRVGEGGGEREREGE